jgi:hypothetical protein
MHYHEGAFTEDDLAGPRWAAGGWGYGDDKTGPGGGFL